MRRNQRNFGEPSVPFRHLDPLRRSSLIYTSMHNSDRSVPKESKREKSKTRKGQLEVRSALSDLQGRRRLLRAGEGRVLRRGKEAVATLIVVAIARRFACRFVDFIAAGRLKVYAMPPGRHTKTTPFLAHCVGWIRYVKGFGQLNLVESIG